MCTQRLLNILKSFTFSKKCVTKMQPGKLGNVQKGGIFQHSHTGFGHGREIRGIDGRALDTGILVLLTVS